MDSYAVSDHGMSGPPPPPGPPQHSSPSPTLLQDQHLQQLQQSIQQQQQQLQQLATGSSSISDLIGMLPQTASLSSGGGGTSSSISSTSGSAMSGGGEPLMSSHGGGGSGPQSHPSHGSHPPPPPPLPPLPPHSQGNLPAHLTGLGAYRPDSHLGLPSPGLYSRHPGLPEAMSAHTSHSSSHSSLPPHSSHSPSHSSMHLHPSLLSPHSQESMSQQGPLPHQTQGLISNRVGLGGTSSISYTRQGDSYICSLCGKTVVSKAAITRHIQLTHEKKKPFECNICHRRFGYKNILLEHQNIHFGIKPYACTLCDKRFAARSNLFQHRLLHMKPYCCYQCNKRFDREEQLQRHLKLHPTANLLSCSECPFSASNVEALNQHLQESHKLLTYDTRRHSSSFDSDGGDLPSQVMSLPSPTLTSPDNTKSPGPHGSLGGLDADPMRRIDSICSQLANNRGAGGMGYHDGFQVKQEPLSPGGVRFPPDMSGPSSSHHFPPSASPSAAGADPPHFSHAGSPTSTMK
ncbi:Zinc finger protein [Plakobranchus ocellatus]|uniref:Zinc finger protein n=1 Tax=Plakobranchus ocellatus TaxID=259542 RepID=A0AAV4CTL3_9GAST|nr:Zinc finger protein [Plakobranchus ocellatus]